MFHIVLLTKSLISKQKLTIVFAKQVGCLTILSLTIHLVLFDNSRMGCFSYMFYYIKKLKLELIKHNFLKNGTFQSSNIITFELSNRDQSNIPPVSCFWTILFCLFSLAKWNELFAIYFPLSNPETTNTNSRTSSDLSESMLEKTLKIWAFQKLLKQFIKISSQATVLNQRWVSFPCYYVVTVITLPKPKLITISSTIA